MNRPYVFRFVIIESFFPQQTLIYNCCRDILFLMYVFFVVFFLCVYVCNNRYYKMKENLVLIILCKIYTSVYIGEPDSICGHPSKAEPM